MVTQNIKKINLKILISYLGIIPFLFMIFDYKILNFFSLQILNDFIAFYSLIIFSFIGALHWNYKYQSNSIIVLYGFLPSLISTILIFFILLGFDETIIFILILILLIIQLILDFLIYRSEDIFNTFFYSVRLPITIIISLNIFYFIFV